MFLVLVLQRRLGFGLFPFWALVSFHGVGGCLGRFHRVLAAAASMVFGGCVFTLHLKSDVVPLQYSARMSYVNAENIQDVLHRQDSRFIAFREIVVLFFTEKAKWG